MLIITNKYGQYVTALNTGKFLQLRTDDLLLIVEDDMTHYYTCLSSQGLIRISRQHVIGCLKAGRYIMKLVSRLS